MRKPALFLGLILIAILSFSQAPQSFNYQALVRDGAGAVQANLSVAVIVSIIQTTVDGTEVFTETHTGTTNDFGLITLSIGTVNSTDFQNIDWSTGPYFLKVNVNGNLLGTTQLLSVPYALHAETVQSISDENLSDLTDGSISGSKVGPEIDGDNITDGTIDESELATNSVGLDEASFTDQQLSTTSSPAFDNLRLINTSETSPSLLIEPGNANKGISIDHNKTTVGSPYGIDVDLIATYAGNKGVIGINSSATSDGGSFTTFGLRGAADGNSTGGKYGVSGSAEGSGDGIGLYGEANSTGTNYGLRTFARSVSTSADPQYAVYAAVNRYGSGVHYSGYFINFGTTGTYSGLYADLRTGGGIDVAEYILDSFDDTEPGDVVIADPDNSESIIKSTKPYDVTVLGVISTEPHMVMGIDLIMDEESGEMYENVNAAQLALVGRVPVKVTDENGAIKIGDLLTTSSKKGHAMKCNDKLRGIGAIIGKALEAHDSGDGKIIVLISLQ